MIPDYIVSSRGSVQLIGEEYWRNGKCIFVPISPKQAAEFLTVVNRAEGRANRKLTDNEVNRIVDHFEDTLL